MATFSLSRENPPTTSGFPRNGSVIQGFTNAVIWRFYFHLMSAWTNCLSNTREAGELRLLGARFMPLQWKINRARPMVDRWHRIDITTKFRINHGNFFDENVNAWKSSIWQTDRWRGGWTKGSSYSNVPPTVLARCITCVMDENMPKVIKRGRTELELFLSPTLRHFCPVRFAHMKYRCL